MSTGGAHECAPTERNDPHATRITLYLYLLRQESQQPIYILLVIVDKR
jgi:hypothetical protein